MAKYRDVIGGCLFFIFAAAYYNMALGIRQFSAGSGMVDSQFMPKVYAVLLMILSSIQVLQGVYHIKKGEAEADEGSGLTVKDQIVSFITSFLLLIIYVALLDSVGFVIMSVLFIICMTILLSTKEQRSKKNLLKLILISVAFSVIVFMIFVDGFGLTLPEGILS